MALQLQDRVLETANSPGTGTVTLLGASLGYQSFNTALTSGNTTYYTIADLGGANWEVGIGTFTSPNQLARNTILDSSGGGSVVNFSSGIQNVFITYPAEKSVNLDANGNCTLPARLTINNVTLASSANTSNLVVGGALGFSDTGLASNFVATHPSYYQAAIQNLSNGSSATSEFIAYNDTATATTNYAAFGMNSSGYTGTGAINSPNHAFFVSASNDIVVGTISNNNIHFVTNSSATDAVTINGVGAIAVNGSFGTAGQALVTNGAGAPPSWTDSPADTAYFLSFMMG
jgi:hypothetical protein